MQKRRLGLMKHGSEDVVALHALKTARCDVITNQLFTDLMTNDIVVVWNLSQLGQSSNRILATIAAIHEAGASLLSLNENITTESPMGKQSRDVFNALHDAQRANISANMKNARAALGEKTSGGTRKKKLTQEQVVDAYKQYSETSIGCSIDEIAKGFGVSASTLYRAFRRLLVDNKANKL